jgi:hypothetical protein
MKLPTARRGLWRPRVMLAAAFVCAILVGVAVTRQIPSLKTRQHEVGIASASALIDSSRSQLADLGLDTGSDVGTLAARASLLASLMATPDIENEIARIAGVPPDDLIANAPASAAAPGSPAPAAVTTISPSNPSASIVNVSIPNLQAGLMPIILVGTRAPTPALAARLANASFTALADDVNSVAAAANVAAGHRLTVRQLGPAVSAVASSGPGLLDGVAAGLATFLLLCAAFLGVPAFREARRRAARAEAWSPASSSDFGLGPWPSGQDAPEPGGFPERGAPQPVWPWPGTGGDHALQRPNESFGSDLWAARRMVNGG